MFLTFFTRTKINIFTNYFLILNLLYYKCKQTYFLENYPTSKTPPNYRYASPSYSETNNFSLKCQSFLTNYLMSHNINILCHKIINTTRVSTKFLVFPISLRVDSNYFKFLIYIIIAFMLFAGKY